MGEAKRRSAPRIASNVPRLDAYLGEDRGEGFEDFVSRMLAADNILLKCGGSPSEMILLRLIRVQLVAVMESLRVEDEAGGDRVTMMTMLPRAMGIAAMNGLASFLKDDVVLREFATVLVEEFRFAAKEVADQIERANADPAEAEG